MSDESLTEESEAVRQVYAALNRNDIPAMAELFDPQIEWIHPAEFPDGGGTHRGREAVQAHLSQARATWAEGSCEPQRLVASGDKIVVFDDVHVRLKDEAQWRDGKLASVYTFRGGKVVQVRVFVDRQQALEWAGAQTTTAV